MSKMKRIRKLLCIFIALFLTLNFLSPKFLLAVICFEEQKQSRQMNDNLKILGENVRNGLYHGLDLTKDEKNLIIRESAK